MDLEDALQELRSRYKEANRAKIFFMMKKMGMKFITQEAVDVAAALKVCHDVGIPKVTVNLLSEILEKEPANLRNRLHTLGDKGIITLGYESVPSAGVVFVYTLNQAEGN